MTVVQTHAASFVLTHYFNGWVNHTNAILIA